MFYPHPKGWKIRVYSLIFLYYIKSHILAVNIELGFMLLFGYRHMNSICLKHLYFNNVYPVYCVWMFQDVLNTSFSIVYPVYCVWVFQDVLNTSFQYSFNGCFRMFCVSGSPLMVSVLEEVGSTKPSEMSPSANRHVISELECFLGLLMLLLQLNSVFL